VIRALFLLSLAACGGKIAPDDTALGGTCDRHVTTTNTTSCTSSDSVTCSTGVYVVSCSCGELACACAKNGAKLKTVPLAACSACAPTAAALSSVYAACDFPY
jgi:hypothetical protein